MVANMVSAYGPFTCERPRPHRASYPREDEDDPRRRRRTEHRRAGEAVPGEGRLRGRGRPRRPRGAQPRRTPRPRPGRARPHAPRARRLGGHARAAPPRRYAHPHAHRARRRRGPHRRPRAGGRRLPRQAVQPPRAGGPRARHPAPHRRRRPRDTPHRGGPAARRPAPSGGLRRLATSRAAPARVRPSRRHGAGSRRGPDPRRAPRVSLGHRLPRRNPHRGCPYGRPAHEARRRRPAHRDSPRRRLPARAAAPRATGMRTLRGRVAGAFALLALAILFALGGVLFVLLRDLHAEANSAALSDLAVPLVSQARLRIEQGVRLRNVLRELTAKTAARDISLFLVDQGGRVVDLGDDLPVDRVDLDPPNARGTIDRGTFAVPSTGSYVYVAAPFGGALTQSGPWALVLARPDDAGRRVSTS